MTEHLAWPSLKSSRNSTTGTLLYFKRCLFQSLLEKPTSLANASLQGKFSFFLTVQWRSFTLEMAHPLHGSECVSPASDRLVLLNWVNVLLTCVLKEVTVEAAKTNAMFAAILNAQAVLIDSLVDDSRKSIGKSAVADVRRTIRLNADAIPTMMDVALANASTCTPSYRNAVLIGTIIDVSLRLKTRSDGKAMIEHAEARLTEYYLKNIVSSRTAVHTAALDSFNDFITHIVTKQKFEAEYLPVLDKMMLRSPEIVLLGTFLIRHAAQCHE